MRGAHKVRESAKPDLPKHKGRIAEKTVGKELPRELEEYRIFGP
jgi:hypothetical protein